MDYWSKAVWDDCGIGFLFFPCIILSCFEVTTWANSLIRGCLEKREVCILSDEFFADIPAENNS